MLSHKMLPALTSALLKSGLTVKVGAAKDRR
jgi:hypothetical protein